MRSGKFLESSPKMDTWRIRKRMNCTSIFRPFRPNASCESTCVELIFDIVTGFCRYIENVAGVGPCPTKVVSRIQGALRERMAADIIGSIATTHLLADQAA